MRTRNILIAIAVFTLCCFASSCVKESGFEERVKDIAKTDSLTSRIATVEEQTAQLTSSVTTLTEEHNKLQKFTGELSAKVAEMEKELATVDARIAAVKIELKDSLDKQKTALIGMLEDYKEDIKGQINGINGQITALKSTDSTLQVRIDNLQKYVNDTLKGTRDWASATFATLAQKDSLAGVTAAIDVYAKKVNDRVDSLASVHSADTATIFAAIRTLGTESAKALEKEVQTLNNTITTTAATIRTEYTAAIKTAIEKSEASIKQWVNAALNDYYTVARVDAMLAVAKGRIDSLGNETTAAEAKIAALEAKVPAIAPTLKDLSDSLNTAYSNIQKVRDSLKTLDYKIDTTRAAITAAYKSAIKDSLDTLRLVMNDSLTNVNARVSALADRMTTVEGSVSTLETNMATVRDSVQTLQAEIAGLRTDVDRLIARIQSIEVIPEYQDGSVGISKSGTVTVSFEVRPASLADSIVKKSGAANFFHLQAVETNAVTKAVTYVNLTVTNPTFGSDSVLTLTVAKGGLPDAFFSEDKFFNARLRISDGNIDKISAFFPLTIATIVYPEAPGLECITINGIVWAPVNCGYDATNYPYGKLYQWGRVYPCEYNASWTDGGGSHTAEAQLQATTQGPVAANAEKSGEFYKNSSSPYDWLTLQDDKRWNDGSDASPVKTSNDPCPVGWRVPTYDELNSLKGSGSSAIGSAGWDSTKKGYWFNGTTSPSVNSGLFLLAAGYRHCMDGNAYDRGSDGRYWSSSVDGSRARYLDFTSGSAYMDLSYRANGRSVRCVKE